MVKLLVLAISDPIFAAKIHETRIYPPSERTTAERIARLRAVMEAGNALDPATNEGRKNRSRLDLMENDSGLLLDLELEWLSPAERLKNGDWQETSDFMTHPEAEHITAFVLERYRRDLAGRRIAIVMAKKITPVNGRGRLGTAAKLPGKMRYLTEYDALITLDFLQWCTLTDKDRQRLIHHELEHLQAGDNNTVQLRTHDFEDFADVITLYGLRSESERFSTDGHSAKALESAAAQLELLNV